MEAARIGDRFHSTPMLANVVVHTRREAPHASSRILSCATIVALCCVRVTSDACKLYRKSLHEKEKIRLIFKIKHFKIKNEWKSECKLDQIHRHMSTGQGWGAGCLGCRPQFGAERVCCEVKLDDIKQMFDFEKSIESSALQWTLGEANTCPLYGFLPWKRKSLPLEKCPLWHHNGVWSNSKWKSVA